MRTLILSTFLMPVRAGPWQQKSREGCYRRLLNISYKDHVTNEEVCNRIQNAIGVHDDLLTMVKKRKPRWYGHISRSSSMAKTILQGTVKGARRRGRQKRWEDNIKEWTGMGSGYSLRAEEDREGWKGFVATSSVVPQRPPRLRDWDEMIRWIIIADNRATIILWRISYVNCNTAEILILIHHHAVCITSLYIFATFASYTWYIFRTKYVHLHHEIFQQGY